MTIKKNFALLVYVHDKLLQCEEKMGRINESVLVLAVGILVNAE